MQEKGGIIGFRLKGAAAAEPESGTGGLNIRIFQQYRGEVVPMEQETKAKQENVVAGIVGAFLGSLIGVVCAVVIGQLGYVASVSGLIMAVGALKGYELLGGSLSKKGAVISSVLVVVMTYLAHRLTFAIALTSAIGSGLSGIFVCFQAVPDLVKEGAIEGSAYWGNLAMLYLFTLVGAVPTILGGLRSASMPDMPRSTAPAGQDGGEVDAAFYPGEAKWMWPLRLSTALSMFVGLVPGVVLIFIGIARDSAATYTLAALGCIAGAVVMMGFALPAIQLANGALFLMARINGTVWKVNLAVLNNQDTYRFTKKLGVLKGLRWEILDGEEQERLKNSVLRAVALLTSGQLMPGSILSMAVSPMADLQVVKEDPWKWKCTYSAGGGKTKKVSIPKAYPGFAPVRGMEPAQEPAPARWGLLGLAVALTALFGLLGAGIGYQIDSPVSGPVTPGPTAAPTQQAPAETPFDPLEQFHVARELGYSYTAEGYIRAPDGMFGDGAFVDAHVPYSEKPEYLDRGRTIRSAAHGMEVTVTIAQTDGNAENVVEEQANELVQSLGDTIYEASDTQYFEDYDIAVKQVSYLEDDQTKARFALLYADYKQDGYYLSACIVYQPELMDEDYPALLAELRDAYALNLPEIEPMESGEM